jgi:hypothetical protein
MGNYFMDYCLKFIRFSLLNEASACPRTFKFISFEDSHEVYRFFDHFPLNSINLYLSNSDNTLI